MSQISKPNTFSANTTIASSEVNDNFDTIYNDYNGSIDANNLATSAVTTAKIADSNVTTAKIADSNVTTAKLADGAVTPDKLATGAQTALVDTAQATSSTSYTDLATAGPEVTVTIGANGLALVIVYAYNVLNTGTSRSHMGFAVSGANTQAAADNYSLMLLASSANVPQVGASAVFLLTGLSAGSTTFTAKYKVTASSSNFQGRRISVIPL